MEWLGMLILSRSEDISPLILNGVALPFNGDVQFGVFWTHGSCLINSCIQEGLCPASSELYPFMDLGGEGREGGTLQIATQALVTSWLDYFNVFYMRLCNFPNISLLAF